MPELPPLVWTDAARQTSGSGYYAAKMLSRTAPAAVRDLAQVRNAKREDLLALIESIQASWQLAMELSAVEQELHQASGRELSRQLSERDYWLPEDRSQYDEDFTPRYRAPRGMTVWQSFPTRQAQIKEWIEENVSEPQRSDFLTLLERRGELREAVVEAAQKFEATRGEIDEALKKSRLIDAVERVNPDAGAVARPELAVESASAVNGRAGAINAGLDEAYFAALAAQPELSELEAAAGAVSASADLPTQAEIAPL